MRHGKIYLLLFWLMVSTFSYALVMPYLHDNRTRKRTQNPVHTQQKQLDKQAGNGAQDKGKSSKNSVSAQPFKVEDDTIPDSLLNTRWKIQLTQPYSLSDLYQSPLDLQRPDNMKYDVVYNDTLNRFVIGNRMGNTWLSAPIMLTPEEYNSWTEMNERSAFFRKKNDEIYQAKGKEKFDFSDMHFDLGQAEKIFGPGGIRVRTQGSAELKLGMNKKRIDNPSLPIRNRKTTMMNFDEKINLNVNGKVGDKVNMNLNYNTDAPAGNTLGCTLLLRSHHLQFQLTKLHIGSDTKEATGTLDERRIAGKRHITSLHKLDNLVFLTIILQFHVLGIIIHLCLYATGKPR